MVIVLGHTDCGAVKATLDYLQSSGDVASENIASIVKRIKPSVNDLLSSEISHDKETLIRESIRANIRVSTKKLRHGSKLLESLIQNKGLLILGAEYCLESGRVEFFENNKE